MEKFEDEILKVLCGHTPDVVQWLAPDARHEFGDVQMSTTRWDESRLRTARIVGRLIRENWSPETSPTPSARQLAIAALSL